MQECFTCKKDLIPDTAVTVELQQGDAPVHICPECAGKLDRTWIPKFFGGRFDFIVWVTAFGLMPTRSKYHQSVIQNCATLEYANLMGAFRKGRSEIELGKALFQAILAYQRRLSPEWKNPKVRDRSMKIEIVIEGKPSIFLWRTGKCTTGIREAYLQAREYDLSL